MADIKTEKQKVREITDKLEEGLKELFNSEQYKNYLTTMSRFHNYSANNIQLIAMQRPDATLVAGYQAWQKKFGRHVSKGEKAIRILAPVSYKAREERNKTDPMTGDVVLDENGMPLKEETETTVPAFRVASVFDVAQTYGRPLPELETKELLSSVDGYGDLKQAVMNAAPVPISFEGISGDVKGYFDKREKRIAVKENMAESQTLEAMIHETAHSMLHDNAQGDPAKDRNTREVEAESVAFTVCQHFGIDTSGYSFGYIAGWSSGRDMRELRSSLDTIRKTSSELIKGIESQLLEIRRKQEKEKGQEAEGMETGEKEPASMERAGSDRISYYVIEDLSARVGRSPEKGEPEHFESITEAVRRFKEFRSREDEDKSGTARAVFGFRVNGTEFDVVQVKNNQNCITLGFTQRTVESRQFREDLNYLYGEIGFDRAEVYREKLPEETKALAKELFELQLNFSGIRDTSIYMDRFDTLYAQGKLEGLMPKGEKNLILRNIPFAEWENPYIDTAGKDKMREERELAFQIADRYISIQETEGGYDYTIYDTDYRELDGGVYDDPDVTIRQALDEIVADLKEPTHMGRLAGNIQPGDGLVPVDYDGLMEKSEQAEKEYLGERIRNEVPEAAEGRVIADFKARTEGLFNSIGGKTQENIELDVYAHLFTKLNEYGIRARIVDMAVSGSRCRGLEQEGSDLDVVVEYRGEENEKDMSAVFNEDDFTIGGIRVDIRPIKEGMTGTLGEYLPKAEAYLEEKRIALQEENTVQAQEEKQTAVTLTVAECGEFHNLGEYHEGIASVEEAVAVFNRIPPERMNGISSIGINIHTEGTERYEDAQIDIVSGEVINLEMLDCYPESTGNPEALAVISKLMEKFPEKEVYGSLEPWFPADAQCKEPELQADKAVLLAAEIDQLSYDYDTYQYKDTVEDRDAQIANIAKDIKNGNTGYLNDFLNAMVSGSIREGMTDIFQKGLEMDDSEAVRSARQAKELLDKLAEYKQLAKIEKVEEQDYNMVDNVFNNGYEELHREEIRKEQDKLASESSLKVRLVEKEIQTTKQGRGHKRNTKNTQREI